MEAVFHSRLQFSLLKSLLLFVLGHPGTHSVSIPTGEKEELIRHRNWRKSQEVPPLPAAPKAHQPPSTSLLPHGLPYITTLSLFTKGSHTLASRASCSIACSWWCPWRETTSWKREAANLQRSVKQPGFCFWQRRLVFDLQPVSILAPKRKAVSTKLLAKNAGAAG